MAEREQLTTAHGAPVGDNQNSLTAGQRGPLLMQDYQLLEKMATFNRERVPERVVHAKGSGAYGTFTVTNDVTRYTKARIFSRNRETDRLSAPFLDSCGGARRGRRRARRTRLRGQVLHRRRELGHGRQ